MIISDDEIKTKKDALEKIERLIINRQKEVNCKNDNPVPEYYYIGIGKTASKAIFLGLDKTTAHWHSVPYFESIYNTKLLTRFNINLFDIILYLSNKYSFKPFIIECYRDPISISISMVIQNIKTKKIVMPNKNQINFILNSIRLRIPQPHALQWNNYFNTNLILEFNNKNKFLYKDTEKAKLLFLRYEDIKKRQEIFFKCGYKYIDSHENKSIDVIGDLYQIVLSKFKLPETRLKHFYDTKLLNVLYTKNEIQNFINKWKIN